MTDTPATHEPTPEFRASLERELTRAFLREQQFAGPAIGRQAGRWRRAFAIAACMVVMLAIGLIWGVGSGFAAARAQTTRPHEESFPLTVLRNMPMRSALTALTCGAVSIAPAVATAQQGVQVVDLPAATVRTTTALGMVYGLKQVAGGKVLVNDGGRRQIRLFDATLTGSTVVSDSTPGSSTSYGPYSVPLISSRGDSTLFPHYPSQSLLVLDGAGQVARVWAMPNDQYAMASMLGTKASMPGVDNRGRFIYKNTAPINLILPKDGSNGSITQPADSAEILRADLDARRVDTLGKVKQLNPGRMSISAGADGKPGMNITINPLQTVDEWAVLSDGTVALIRGHDYHIDWIHPDGSKSASPKLPFDWKRLTDDDKQKLVDSARTAETAASVSSTIGAIKSSMGAAGATSASAGDRAGEVAKMAATVGSMGGTPRTVNTSRPPQFSYVPLSEMADYYPAIRKGAAVPDLDGNLWILPTTSAQSKNGELVYDVVSPKAGLFERVRLPAGRSIAGFGKGGVVYLISGDRATGFYLERTTLTGGAATPTKK